MLKDVLKVVKACDVSCLIRKYDNTLVKSNEASMSTRRRNYLEQKRYGRFQETHIKYRIVKLKGGLLFVGSPVVPKKSLRSSERLAR